MFLSPVVLVPAVCVVGLGLFARGFPQLGNCVEIGLPMLVVLVISQQYLLDIHPVAWPMLERFALLVCIGLIWAFAAILTAAGAYNHVKEQTKSSCRTDHSLLMSSSPWIKIPYPFQWGTLIFRASHVFGMMGAAFVSSAESTATFYAAARLAGATSPPGHVLSRSIGLQGQFADREVGWERKQKALPGLSDDPIISSPIDSQSEKLSCYQEDVTKPKQEDASSSVTGNDEDSHDEVKEVM
ncbi:N-terminal acetyltransferase [Castilleja foliolosa]|uniref:N-terminal acetyltransferase n=1 Tax=Castilleja foliolosa TaxID=1961234 RepID=A0ABD3DXT8_9LAMI